MNAHGLMSVADGPPRSAGQPRPCPRLRVAFLIRGLDRGGGAARQLVVLAKALHERGHRVVVVTFYAAGPLEVELRESGVRVRTLDKRGRWDLVRSLRRLYQVLREERPDVLHGYLTEPNILALGMRAVFDMRVVWGVRASHIDARHTTWVARVSARLAAALSRYPDLLIANSRVGRDHAVERGYPRSRTIVISNGIDTDLFKPDRIAGRRVRAEWNVPDAARLIGLVGRVHPMKDHATFLAAAARLARQRDDVRFVCVGGGDPAYAESLRSRGEELALGDRLIWAHPRPDMSAVHNALDILCSSSAYGEGFPNVVGEAMACGIPCVVTDVGDSAWIVDDVTLVVPPRDPGALADRLGSLLASGDRTLARVGARARQRIVERFSVERLVEETELALGGLVGVGV